MKKEVVVSTVIQYKQRSNHEHQPRWDRTRRAVLFDQYHDLGGVSNVDIGGNNII
jgi:hypothetical protein